MDAPEESQTVSQHSTTSTGLDIETLKTILLGLLCAVLLFLLIFLIINTWPTLVGCYRKFIPEDKQHVEKRTQTIRSWTISKPVMDHERHCRLYNARKTHENHPVEYPSDESSHGSRDKCSTSSASGSSLESTKVQSCGICFEQFRVNEMASWASTSDCQHAFHPHCIEKWLLRHDDCPICRRKYLLVDYTRQSIPNRTLKALAKERKKRRKCTYFCVRDGLVFVRVDVASSSFCLATEENQESDGMRGGNRSNEKKESIIRNPSIESDSGIVDGTDKPIIELPFRRSTNNVSGSLQDRSRFMVDNISLDNNQWVISKTESTETAFTLDSSTCSSQV